MRKLLTLAQNTFTETLRQPVYAVIIAAALFLLALSPALTMYTMSDDNKLLREIGLSTLFLTSLFIAVFAAAGAVAEEIENKTIMTVLSKPVSRPLFILAKFFGVTAAVALAHYICTIALLMSIRHGVPESISDPLDHTVIVSAALVLTVSFLLSAFFDYAYGWRFSASVIVNLAIFGTIAIIFLYFTDSNWRFNPGGNNISIVDFYGSILLFLASVIMAAIAVGLSSRFNIMVTLSSCSGIFLLGLISDYTFGRLAQTHLWAKMARFVVPNLQIFWISDAIYEGSGVPVKYIMIVLFYTICYAAAILSVAVAVFQRRQVG